MSEPASADTSFRSSLTRHATGAVGLVVVVAVLFWAIGALGGDDDDLTAATEPTIDDADDVDDLDDLDPDGGDDPGAEPTDPDADAETDESSEADDAETDEGGNDDGETDEGGNDDGETDDAGDDDAGDEGGEDADAEDETPRIDPATISVQVLDGYQADGGAAADQVAQQLDEEGYDIIARNPALRYDVTTVLWTAGFEDEGRQVAADIGAAEAREQPGTLSDAVAVHVVVGADRG